MQPRKVLERLELDLAHAFACQAQSPADLLERLRLGVVEPVAKDQDLPIAIRKRAERLLERLAAERDLDLFLRQGCVAGWDLAHAAGNVPLRLHDWQADFGVWCSYKYLNAGPGAPAFVYVARELQPRLRSPIWGWFGQRDQFAMDRGYDPVEGIGRFLAGTPPVLDLAAVEEGVKLTAEAGVDRLREKSLALCELIVSLHDAWLAPLGFSIGTPRDPARRGSHVALRHERAWPITRALIDARVTPDFRGPDSIRLGVAPLYTSYVEVWDALDRLRAIASREVPEAEPARVT